MTSKRSINLIIICFYVMSLLCGIDSIIKNDFINNIRLILQISMPIIIICSILFDNKDFKILKKNKTSMILLIINIIWILITILFGIHKGFTSIKGIVNFSSILFMTYLLTNIEFGKEDSNKLAKHILISGMICAVYGILQYIFKINLDTLSNSKYPGILGRVNSTFYLATLYDKYMLLIFAFSGFNYLKENKKSYLLLFILSFINIILTFARAGLIGAIIVIIFYIIGCVLYKEYKKILIPILLFLSAFLIPGFKYSFQSTLDYFYDKLNIPSTIQIKLVSELTDSTGEEIKDINNDLSIQYRKVYENIGKEFIKEYPITGIGYNNYSYLYQNQNASLYLENDDVLSYVYEYMYPHNGYIQMGAEIGIFGLILYFGYIIYLTVYSILKSKSKYKWFSLVILVLFMLGNDTETLMYNKQYLFLFAIIYSLYNNIYIKK